MVGRFQAGLPVAVPPRQAKAALVERADHPNRGAALQEGIKHQCDAGLEPLRSGAFVTTPEASRTSPIGNVKASSPRSALANKPAVSRLRIVCNSSFEMVPFKPSRKPAVRGSRVVDAVAVGDQALTMPTNIEQRIPVGAVAGELA